MRSQPAFDGALPRKRVTAGVLVRNGAGQVLLVEPTYRSDWLTPGGSVEAHESPRRGAEREVMEELGFPLRIGRALVMQWIHAEGDPDGALNFAYDGGTVDAATIERFTLPVDELASYRFVDPDRVAALTALSESPQTCSSNLPRPRGHFSGWCRW